MRMLAIECATEVCSLALFEGETLLDSRHEILGRAHAEQLVPLIASLSDKGRAEEIRVSLGPGSFTGIRIGLAAARALGLAWQARVLGYPTPALIAASSPSDPRDPRPFETGGPPGFLVCMAGGHGEWFVQPFNPARLPAGKPRSMKPQDAVDTFPQPLVVGSRAKDFVALRGSGTALEAAPNARYAKSIAGDVLTTDLRPIYGRGPDARLPA